jgi:hypothetical protein
MSNRAQNRQRFNPSVQFDLAVQQNVEKVYRITLKQQHCSSGKAGEHQPWRAKSQPLHPQEGRPMTRSMSHAHGALPVARSVAAPSELGMIQS